jgi:4-hydroxy-3-polyprenylbenzoate decarboxylase
MAQTISPWLEPHVKHKVIVAISGASGAIYGVRLLQILRETQRVQTHLVVSEAGRLNLRHELNMHDAELAALADVAYPIQSLGAAIASGSFQCDSMVVAPCSMRTLAAISHAMSDNLITRAADVMLKERRRLVLMVRETPLHLAHLRNMQLATEMGAIIYPPVPCFYHRPHTLMDMVDHTLARVLDLLGLANPNALRWNGLPTDC